MARIPTWISPFVLAAVTALAQSPELYLTHIDSQGARVRLGAQQIRVPGNERIRLYVVINTTGIRDPLEQPEVQAENQHPDYFKQRPPANIRLAVRRLSPEGPRDVAIRIYSSGGGQNLKVYERNTDLDIIADAAVREAKFREAAERFLARARQEAAGAAGPSAALSGPGALDTLVRYLEQTNMAYIAPGEYEITAFYTPSTQNHWRGRLVSKPARVAVFDAELRTPR